MHHAQDCFDPGPQPAAFETTACRSGRHSTGGSAMHREYDDRGGRNDRDRSDRRRDDRAGRHDRTLDRDGRHDRDRDSSRRHESNDRPRDPDRDRDGHHDRPRDRHERVRDRSRDRSREPFISRDRERARSRDPKASGRDSHSRCAPRMMHQPCMLCGTASEAHQAG